VGGCCGQVVGAGKLRRFRHATVCQANGSIFRPRACQNHKKATTWLDWATLMIRHPDRFLARRPIRCTMLYGPHAANGPWTCRFTTGQNRTLPAEKAFIAAESGCARLSPPYGGRSMDHLLSSEPLKSWIDKAAAGGVVGMASPWKLSGITRPGVRECGIRSELRAGLLEVQIWLPYGCPGIHPWSLSEKS
jgi:hypothetical protein